MFSLFKTSWNVMAHMQKPDFDFRRNGWVHLKQRGRQFSRLLAAKLCASVVVMLDTPCSEVVWKVLATHSIRQFPFTSPPVHHCMLSHFNWSLPCSSTPFLVIAILILLTEIFITNWFHFSFNCIHIALYMVFHFFRQFTIMCIQ